MTKYHISASGRPAVCKAEQKACPLGGQHFETRAAATTYIREHTQDTPRANHFPAPESQAWLWQQAAIMWAEDGRFGSGRNIYVEAGDPTDVAGDKRRACYTAGFMAAARLVNLDEDAAWQAVQATTTNNGSLLYDVQIWRIGFRRARRIMRGNPSEFVRKGFRDSNFNHRGKDTRYANLRFLHNPFKRGDEIVLPAGTQFRTDQPKYRKETGSSHAESKVARKYRVDNAFQGSVDGAVGWRVVKPGVIWVTGSGGYRHEVAVTPDLLAANGQDLFEHEADHSGYIHESPIYG